MTNKAVTPYVIFLKTRPDPIEVYTVDDPMELWKPEVETNIVTLHCDGKAVFKVEGSLISHIIEVKSRMMHMKRFQKELEKPDIRIPGQG